MATNVLNTLIDKGTSLSSSVDQFNKLLSDSSDPNWLSKILDKVSGALNSASDALNNANNFINDKLNSFNLDSLLDKIGLGNNKLLSSLANKFGLKSGLFDSWASDLVNMGLSFADSMVHDLAGAAVLGLLSLMKDDSVYDQVILNSIVKPLRYTGSNPNYKNKLLQVCLESDLPVNLDYLDSYNGTVYDYSTDMWKRGIYSAQHGCYKVPKYVCKKIYESYKGVSGGLATDDPDLAFLYKSQIVEIFKNVLVYTYDNFTDERFIEFVKEFPDILNDFSYFNDTENSNDEFNGKYCINDNDIDTIASKVELSDFGSNNNGTRGNVNWMDPGCGVNIDITNITNIKEYISIRNSYFKKIYVYMTHSDEIPLNNRLINKDLHRRLEYKNVDMLKKASSDMLNSLKSSKLYNDFRYVFDTNGDANGEGLIAGGIANTLNVLQQVKALFTIEQLYSFSNSLQANLNQVEVGEFVTSDDDGIESVDNPDDPSNIDNSETQQEKEDEIDKICDNYPDNESIFTQNDIKSSNFDVLVVTNLSETDIQNATTKLLSKNPDFTIAEQFNLNKINSKGIYNITESITLYTNKKDIYDNLSDEEKDSVRKYVFAKYMIRSMSSKYTLQALKGLYGESKTSENITENTPDKKISDYLDTMSDLINTVRNALSDMKDISYSISFENQGIGNTLAKISNIKPLSILSSYKPNDLVDNNNTYVFIGWSENINDDGSSLFDFDNRYLDKNLTLYAIWEKAENYILSAVLKKSFNPSLTEDVYGTIDNTNNLILFPIKESEKTEDDSYILNITLSNKATSNVYDGNVVIINNNSVYEIDVSNAFNASRRYSLKTVNISDDEKRLAYMTSGCFISSLVGENIHYTNSKSELLTASKSGYIFKGWKNNSDLLGDTVESLSSEVNKSFETLYPVFEKIKYSITYKDKLGVEFTGTHTNSYPISIAYDEGLILDNPSKKDNVFLGYFKNIECTGNPINALHKYSVTSNITLYADWMDKNAYNALYGEVPLKGTYIRSVDLTFYTSFVLSNNQTLKITEFGFGLYGTNGSKIRDIIVENGSRIVLGVTYISSIDTFLILTKNANGTIYQLYYTDRNFAEFTTFIELENINDIKFFSGIGFESLSNLTFFTRVLYKGALITIDNNSIKIDDNVVFNKDNISAWPTDETSHPLTGISMTINGSLFALFYNYGIIEIKGFVISRGDNGELLIDLSDLLSKQATTSTDVALDSSSIGTTSNNLNNTQLGNPDTNDIDINDRETIAKTLKNMKEKYAILNTYKNPGKVEYVMSENGTVIPVLPESIKGDWVWKVKDDNSSILYLFDYDGKGLYTLPDIRSPKINITLFRKDVLKNIQTIDMNNIFEYNTININKNNYKSYVGWTRKENETETRLTEDYLNEYWSDKTEPEYWIMKLDRSEVEPLSESDNTLVYKGQTIIPSEIFNENNNVNIEDLTASAMDKQEELANKYKDEIFVSTDKTGKKRYDGITEAYYNYITEDYKQDRNR